jgi:hypothetical protein
MQEMNYGRGSNYFCTDLINNLKVFYRVGGGMELLQFLYFAKKGGVVGVDVV